MRLRTPTYVHFFPFHSIPFARLPACPPARLPATISSSNGPVIGSTHFSLKITPFSRKYHLPRRELIFKLATRDARRCGGNNAFIVAPISKFFSLSFVLMAAFRSLITIILFFSLLNALFTHGRGQSNEWNARNGRSGRNGRTIVKVESSILDSHCQKNIWNSQFNPSPFPSSLLSSPFFWPANDFLLARHALLSLLNELWHANEPRPR